MMYASKESGGNPKSTRSHDKVDEAAHMVQQAVNDLTLTLEKAGGEAGLISGKGCRTTTCILCVTTYTLPVHYNTRNTQPVRALYMHLDEVVCGVQRL